MKNIELENWLRKALWSEKELQAFCCGLAPDKSRASTAELNEVAEDINRAVLASQLTAIQNSATVGGAQKLYGVGSYFKPSQAIAWAAPLYPKFPFNVTDLALSDEENDVGGERKEETLLRTIGAMALVLAAQKSAYKKGDDNPNAKQIAVAVIEMIDAMNDINSRGLGSANIRNAIAEGIKLLKQ